MRALISSLFLLIISVQSFAQSDDLESYINRAFAYSNNGEYAASLDEWDLYLSKVQETEGDDCSHYFMGIVYKAKVLIDAQRYQEAETILLSHEIPDDEVDLKTIIQYLCNLGECSYFLGKYDQAIAYYFYAYNFLFENKEYYMEIDDADNHWCWREELCYIALKLADIFYQLGYLLEAKEVIEHTLDNVSYDIQKCLESNSGIVFILCLKKKIEIYDNLITVLIENNSFEDALLLFKTALEICESHPSLIAELDLKTVNSSIFPYLLKNDKDKALRVAHVYQDAEEYDLAESYYLKVKQYLEDNNESNNKEYLHILSELSYIHEMKYKATTNQ